MDHPNKILQTPTDTYSGFLWGKIQKIILSEYFVLYLTIIYMLVLLPFIPRVLSLYNLQNILSNTWPLLAVAIGQTFVLIVAGIDLSQTSIMAVTSVVGAMVMTKQLDPALFSKSPLWGTVLNGNGGLLAGSMAAVPVAILIMLLIGLLIGFINGFSVAYFKMPPFMVTLVSMMFFAALAKYLPKSENIMHLPDAFNRIGNGTVGLIPIAMIVAVVLAAAAHLMLSRTLYGRKLYATGINERASIVSGISAKKIKVSAYVISGFFAAVGSILYSSRLEMGRPTLGSTLLLDVIGANVIGGISLFGGKGKVTWTFLGVFFFVILANTLNLLNIPFYLIDMVKGSVILIAAVLDVFRTDSAMRRGIQ